MIVLGLFVLKHFIGKGTKFKILNQQLKQIVDLATLKILNLFQEKMLSLFLWDFVAVEGGKARTAKLCPDKDKEIRIYAANKRWKKQDR